MDRIQQLAQQLGLHPHPEGGFFTETWRAETMVGTPNGPRPAGTAIYFLLTKGNFSAFHRIASDEVWHFYEGDPVLVHTISNKGDYALLRLGNGANPGTSWQATVAAGDWFASECDGPLGYALVGCTVSPGFDFRDFELASREKLSAEFPAHQALIHRLTRA